MRPPKPRVAIVIPSLRSGGCERQVANLLEDLQARFCFELLLKEPEIAFPIPPTIPIHCSNIDMSADHTILFKGWRFVRRVVATGRLLRTGKYDLVCTFIDLNNVVTFIAAQLFRVSAPIVAVEQTVIPEYFEHDPLARRYRSVIQVLLRFVYRRVARVVALTEAIAAFLHEAFRVGRPIDVIAPGVDPELFRPRAATETVSTALEAEFVGAPLRILSVGGLIERKDHAFLVRAMRFVASAKSGAHLFILGAGPEEARVRELVHILGLSRCVHLLGWRPNVEDYVRFADVSVLASNSDPLPQVLLESLMSGVPVVTTRSTSEWDQLLSDPRLGRVVRRRDESDFASAILDVIADEAERCRDFRANYARSRFNRNLMAEAYGRVIAECLPAHPVDTTEPRGKYGGVRGSD